VGAETKSQQGRETQNAEEDLDAAIEGTCEDVGIHDWPVILSPNALTPKRIPDMKFSSADTKGEARAPRRRTHEGSGEISAKSTGARAGGPKRALLLVS
jgi:hypothetical protein